MPKHIVEQGDFIARLAEKYGFLHHETIWNYGANKDLKALRKTPNVLYPGDVVEIPERTDKVENCQTTRVHTFTIPKDKLQLRLVFKDYVYDPIAATECTISVDGNGEKKTTDGDGRVETPINTSAKTAELTIRDHSQIALIGHLDPVTESSGQIARLNNLGYHAGPIEEPIADMLRSAIEEFQCDHKPLKVDGVCGSKTQAKLEEVHGS